MLDLIYFPVSSTFLEIRFLGYFHLMIDFQPNTAKVAGS